MSFFHHLCLDRCRPESDSSRPKSKILAQYSHAWPVMCVPVCVFVTSLHVSLSVSVFPGLPSRAGKECFGRSPEPGSGLLQRERYQTQVYVGV